MPRLLAPSTESFRERQLIGAGTVLLHALLVWWLLYVAGNAASRGGVSQQGFGDALVVDFVAIPEPAPIAKPSLPITAQASVDPADSGQTLSTDSASPGETVVTAHVLSKTGAYVPPSEIKKSEALAASQSSNTSTTEGGSPENDLLARYRAALRARIAQTWRALTDRRFPSGCGLLLSQSVGGAVTASSANGCGLSTEDRLQLEAAALMAQPLPYTGYEAAFAPEMRLDL